MVTGSGDGAWGVIRKPAFGLFFLVSILILSGCSNPPKRPVVYPNAKATSAGPAQVARDVEACMTLARQYGIGETRQDNIARDTATGALLGGVAAGTWGLVRGDATERAAAGAAAGAATAATRSVITSTENRLNPTFQGFVQRCLSERGYEVIGWE